MKPFPFKRFLINGLYVTLVNIACALVVTAVTGRADRFPIVLFFSVCIGTTIFIGIEGVRLALWGNGEKINWALLLPLLLIIVPAGQVAGSHLGAFLLGLDPVGNTPVLWSRRWLDDLLFTFTASGAAIALFIDANDLPAPGPKP